VQQLNFKINVNFIHANARKQKKKVTETAESLVWNDLQSLICQDVEVVATEIPHNIIRSIAGLGNALFISANNWKNIIENNSRFSEAITKLRDHLLHFKEKKDKYGVTYIYLYSTKEDKIELLQFVR